MTILYFTATGNNLYLAKRLGGQLYSIPQAIKSGSFSFIDDKIGLIFPIYILTVPPYIKEFLQNAELNSNYIFSIMSYGMYDGAATSHLVEILTQTGILFSYINTIKMVDNWLPKFYMEKQIKTQHKKKIEMHLDEIISDISGTRQWILKDSGFDKIMTKCTMKVFTSKSDQKKVESYIVGRGIDNFFSIEDSCTKCGVCVKVCPVDNIQLQDHVKFHTNCISCLACIHNCPQNAICLSGERSKVRFRNQHISLKEIVNANK